MRSTFGTLPMLALSALAVACSDGKTSAKSDKHNGPTLVRLDSVILAESDADFLGKPPVAFAADSSGRLYIADAFTSRVFRFARSGSLESIIGRRGDGPGEFRNLIGGTFLWDSLLVQPAGLDLVVFNRYSGKYLGRQRLNMGYFTQGNVSAGRLLMSNYDYATKKGMISIAADTFIQAVHAENRQPLSSNMVPLPVEYDQYPELATANWSMFVSWDDTLLTGYAAVPYLTIRHLDGTVEDTLTVPARMRRGFPTSSYDLFRKGTTASSDERARAKSILQYLWRLSDGRIVLGYRDSWVERLGTDERYFGRIWLTLLSRNLDRACPDVEVPFPGTDWPRMAFQGDTIYALDQVGRGTGDSMSVLSIVYRYLLDDTSCRWLPVEHRHIKGSK